MRKRYPKLLLFGLLLMASHAFAGPKGKTVLITAFEPFDGRKENSSQAVAQEIAKNSAQLLGENVRVETCTLPIIYEKAAEVAKRCYERMIPPPDLVLSLGEGTPKVFVEMIIKNENSTDLVDSSGKLASAPIITKDGPERIYTAIPIFQLYPDGFTALENGFFRLSADSGKFVCNNTAYLLGRYFEKEMVPYGFIHVPIASTFSVDADFVTWLSSNIISKITKTTLDFYANETSKRLKLVKTYFEEFQKANPGL